ncbi:hypothetical protein EHZ19_16175 [Paraburkholderia bannensis]|nr:hypothetical protein [Paraburkholderia bannensis]RQM47188.1 hypothetical protein EHZ19_16175 [Paraburkholderia bannensis]
MTESTNDKGKDHARRLIDWINRTSLSNIPTNQFGQANRYAIFRQLGISRSTISSNSEIKSAFENLDLSLLELKNKHDENLNASPKRLEHEIALHSQISELSAENENLKIQLLRLRYLEDFGHLLEAL